MLRLGVVWLVIGWFAASPAVAEEAFFRVQVTDLKFTDGELPDYSRINDLDWLTQQRVRSVAAHIQLDQPGEAFLQTGNSWQGVFQWSIRDDQQPIHLALRSSAKQDVTGRLIVPKADGSGLVALKFRIPADVANATARREFQFAKIEHYERRLFNDDPGAAWCRHQIESARKALGELNQDERQKLQQISAQRWNGGRRREDEFDRTYELFSGGRAVSENLQLDRELLFPRGNADQAKPVALDSITGITVKEIDWKPLLKDAKPTLDPLASSVPADQHVVFFPTFAALLKVADEAKQQGTAVLRNTELASQDTHLVERYEQQLGLSLSVLGRMIGPKLVSSVAITGSDPYFATGTDVAVLFEAKQPSVLAGLMLAKIRLDAVTVADAKPVDGMIDGIKYVGIRSPDRRVCSFVAELGNVVVVTNSLAQLQRLATVKAGKATAMDSLPEYAFFRQRYQLGDASESALLFISDATIRRWCGPRWRIASSRRTRDAAVLTQLQAEHLDALVTGKDLKLGAITTDLPTSLPANAQLTASGVISPTLGRPDFQTPIAELNFNSVTTAERDAYQRWRDGYQTNWSGAFDPIALRIGTDEKRLLADLSIMPLILGSEYREMVQLVSGVKLTAESGDPHDTLAHVVIALNVKSPPVQMANQFLAGIMAGQTAGVGGNRVLDPLGWLGKSIAVYADRDPYWGEMLKLDPHERQLKIQRDGFRLPVAIRIEVAQPLKLALFLTSLRAFIQQSGPGLTKWETLTHREQQYVKISSARRGANGLEEFDDAALYYGTVGDGLIFTPNEDVFKRAIDRQLARDEKAAGEPGGVSPRTSSPNGRGADADPLAKTSDSWLGESVAVSFEQLVPSFFAWIFESDVRQMSQAAQRRSWSNLSILNEWKRRYPDRDPVEVHSKFWNVELVCPGGGKYVWNEKWNTMESSVFGHPGEPKMPELSKAAEPDSFKPGLFPFTRARFGLTFELDGLRSRLELMREAKP